MQKCSLILILSALSHTIHTESSHTTHTEILTTHAEHPDENKVPEADFLGEDDGKDSPSTREEFDFDAFYELANRVLTGDSDAMASLNSLKIDGSSTSRRARTQLSSTDSLPDLVTGPVPRSGVESHGCSSSSQSGLPTCPAQEKEAQDPPIPSIPNPAQLLAKNRRPFHRDRRLDMEDVIEGGPWLFQGQPIVLQPWEQGMSLRRQKHTQIPVWIRLRHLPMEYWTDEGLSTVASVLALPYTLTVSPRTAPDSTLPGPVLRNGKEDPKRIDVEYEWLPQRCKNCCSLGHVSATCPANMKKTVAPPITIFVQKQPPRKDLTPPELKLTEGPRPEPSSGLASVSEQSTLLALYSGSAGLDKGKDIVLHNSYSALDTELTKEAEATEFMGPNESSPMLGDL
ncbi:UNVERIFIED_CONTAM: hypothetical protein Sangu_3245500 [Sesamum angustifolium]|uniref:DUF4283 domain-containing protein n=1 Tax=Sesamum angustifolium TaxID=2727405 RepID=A0AAW2JF59_9LAMI